MDAQTTTDTDHLIATFFGGSEIKVWSYLTTILGDMAPNPGDEVSGLVLSALTERIGIKPQAMRVALHRLKNDGWITARREGRQSRYSLSETGLRQTHAASHRIYAPQIDPVSRWHVIIAKQPGIPSQDQLPLAPNIFLGSGHAPQGDATFCIEFNRDTIPPWVVDATELDGLKQAYANLKRFLSAMQPLLENADRLPPLDAATIRLLTVHEWRRVLLRHAPLVETLFGQDWGITQCRNECAAVFKHLPRHTGAELAQAIST
ncbi:PaaX family transcriptional regulator C-terminal domain-containing protein [Actibacterium lipolyticum]|uniref:Transcriptional repressor PaaX n=1 Tax=Actibacterium lipolyticum TaxID=1524263 RepID=A0A238L8E3_9RHOB|nr:PaaX family transcriptional regulator C-terminal domain-containing protein [Actibacterium lipolyticum]SMX51090.1 Transcriptional repressor PaaX [Actibacterium lipolyticum]